MSVIQIRVDDQQIALTNMPIIASGGIEENQIEFDFSSDWAGFTCVACFYREGECYTSLVDAETGLADIPYEATETDGRLYIGVMGTNENEITKTSELIFYKILEGALTEDFDPGEPTPDIYNQILSYVSQVVERDQRLAAVEAKATTNENNISTNASNIASEASTRASEDNLLQAQIDQLVAPSGEAPSAAEIENARIGADGVTYDTLGNAIRTQFTDVKSETNAYGEVTTITTTKVNAYFNSAYLTATGGTTFLVDLQNMSGNLYIMAFNNNRFRWGLFTDAFDTAPASKWAQVFTDAGNSNKTLSLEYDDYKAYKTLALHLATPYTDSVSCEVSNYQTKENLQEQIDSLATDVGGLRASSKTVIVTNPISELYNAKNLAGVQTHNGQVPLETVYQNWSDLVTAYPNYMTGYRLGTDTTSTYDINCYTISSKNNVSVGNATVDHDSNKHLKVIWISSIHGDEANTTNEDYCFFKDLLENHDSKDVLGAIWDNVDFLVVPVANPWGYVNLSRFNSNGVNLNRNFPYNWQHIDQQTDPYNYGGEAANDQKETQLLVGFINANLDAYIAVNRHGTATFTAGNVIGYIWSAFEHDRRVAYGSFRPVDTLLKDTYSWICGDKATNKNHNILTVQDNVVYGGTLDGWFNNAKNIHGFLLELGNSAGADYPNYTAKDYHEMCITTIGNLLSAFTVNNGFVWDDNTPS